MERTKGKWKVFNLTDVFTDTHPKGKGDIHICDCKVHEKIFGTDKELQLEDAQANAEFICKAANSHDKLVEACRELLAALANCPGEFNYDPKIEDRALAALDAAGEK